MKNNTCAYCFYRDPIPALVYQNVNESTNADTRDSETGKYDLSSDVNIVCRPMSMVLSDGIKMLKTQNEQISNPRPSRPLPGPFYSSKT